MLGGADDHTQIRVHFDRQSLSQPDLERVFDRRQTDHEGFLGGSCHFQVLAAAMESTIVREHCSMASHCLSSLCSLQKE